MNKVLVILATVLLITGNIDAQPKNTKPALKTASVNKGSLSILLLLNNLSGGENTADGASAIFNDDYSKAIGDEDSYKLQNLDENIAINRNGILLSIEGRPGITGTDTLPLKLYNYRQTSYILRLKGSNFADSLTAVIKDAWLNTETPVDLATTTSLSFTISNMDGSSADNRFSIIFRTRTVPAAITLPPTDAVACKGGNTVFSTTANGFYLTWQWQVSTDGGATYSNITDDAVYNGAATRTLTITGTAASLNNNLYRVAVAGLSPRSVDTSSAARLTIANTWAGNNGTDWSNSSNWACLVVPGLTDDVIVPASVMSMPKLTVPVSINSVTIKAGAGIVLNGNTLTVNGSVSGTGVFTGSSAAGLVLNGTGPETLYFDQAADTMTNVLKSLTVNRLGGSVMLGNRLYISDVLTATNGTLNTNSNLTLRSTSIAATARVAPVGGGAFINGNVTVERFIPARRAYRFISPAVTTSTSLRTNWMEGESNPYPAYSGNRDAFPGFGTHITGSANVADSFDATATNAASLYTFDNNSQRYMAVPNTHNVLTAGVPLRLFVRGNRGTDLSQNNPPASNTILRATGVLKQGDVTFNTSTNPALSASVNNFNLIGNPYASDVSWTSLQRTGLSETYYILDPNLSNGRGVFVNYNIQSGSNNGSSEMNDNIQSGQGFFVLTTAASPALTFKESYKTAGTNTGVFKQTADLTRLGVQLLFDSTGGVSNNADGLAAVFNDTFSPNIGPEDALKIPNRDENMAISHNDTPLSIEGLPEVKGSDTLHLKLWQYRRNSYYLKFDPAKWPATATAYLSDAYLHSEQPIDLTASSMKQINITTDTASAAADRFSIVFKSAAVLPVTVTDVSAAIKGKGIQVNWISQAETNIDRYEIERSVTGQQFEKSIAIKAKGNNGVAETYTWFDENVTEGVNYYRIRVIDKSGAIAYTQIVKATMSKISSSITVYPNPVKGSVINLHFIGMEKGRYTVTLYNNAGQKIYTTVVEHTGLSATYPVKPGQIISKGTYRLHASNGKKVMNTQVAFE